MFAKKSEKRISDILGITLDTPNTAKTLSSIKYSTLSEILNIFEDDDNLYFFIDKESTIPSKLYFRISKNYFIIVGFDGSIYTLEPYDKYYKVIRHNTFNVLKGNGSNYIKVKVNLFGKFVTVSRLVAYCFTDLCGDDPNCKYEVHHINGDPTDNEAFNLVFLDRKTHKKLHDAYSNMNKIEKEKIILDIQVLLFKDKLPRIQYVICKFSGGK